MLANLITGGTSGSIYSSVGERPLIYKDNFSTPLVGPPMNYGRYYLACAIFESPYHDGRPLLVAVGDCCNYQANKAETLDYTLPGATWELSKII